MTDLSFIYSTLITDFSEHTYVYVGFFLALLLYLVNLFGSMVTEHKEKKPLYGLILLTCLSLSLIFVIVCFYFYKDFSINFGVFILILLSMFEAIIFFTYFALYYFKFHYFQSIHYDILYKDNPIKKLFENKNINYWIFGILFTLVLINTSFLLFFENLSIIILFLNLILLFLLVIEYIIDDLSFVGEFDNKVLILKNGKKIKFSHMENPKYSNFLKVVLDDETFVFYHKDEVKRIDFVKK